MKVLIVDDSTAIRERLVEMVHEVEGMSVAGQAGDVAEAIANIRDLQPDVVLLDLAMPGGSGFDVLRALPIEGWSPVPLILSNHATAQYRQESLRLGAHSFFDKSRDWEHLRSTLESLRASGPALAGPEQLGEEGNG